MARRLLDRTIWELAQERGPVRRSQLHRVALALEAAGAADNLDEARELIWTLGESVTLGRALEHAGVDVAVLLDHLRRLDAGATREGVEAERVAWKRTLA